MRITDLLDRRSVTLTAAPKTKSETLDMAVDLMVKSEKISDREAYRKQVYLREEESTTGIGEGIAIPHGKCDAVKKPGLAAMVIKNGVEFEALDDEPVTLLFLIAAPNTEDNIHLDVLSKLSVMLMDEEFTESLRNASSVDEFMDIIDRADSEKKDIDERLADTGSAEGTQAKILAVTSCPTGIAHTYMAAEGIEKAAKAKNCFVKIETRGSGGAKNVLTDQEIADADCIIVAADAKVPMERFDGKKVIECQVSDGISKADQLIDRAINGDAPVYHAAAGSQTSSAGNKSGGSVGHKIYMQLMNGVSHMLPLVVGGGILIAIALAIVIYIVLTKTTFGYELRACGANRHAARYAGIHDKRNIVLSMAIAGALAGAAGSLYYLAGNTEFYWNTYQTLPAAGFNGIAVALLAVNNPIAVIFTGCFMSILDIAGMQITNLTAYNEYITDVIIAVIVYMAAFSLVIKMWISGRKKKKPAHTETAESTAEPAVPQDETGAGVLPAAEGKEAQE